LHHWRRGEVSDWLRRCIKDPPLADRVAEIERNEPDDAGMTRRRVRELIEETYTLPAESAKGQTSGVVSSTGN
jgi:hypothetical protein